MSPFNFDILPGWKTHIAAIGLVGLAIYQMSQNDVAHAFQTLMTAMTASGVRGAISRNERAMSARHEEMLRKLNG